MSDLMKHLYRPGNEEYHPVESRMDPKAHRGLNKRLEVVPGERTPKTDESKIPFYLKLVTATDKKSEVAGELVYPFSAKKCFELLKDYRVFLLSHLKNNEKEATEALKKQFHAKPTWISAGTDGKYGSVGSMVQYAFYDNSGVVFWMVDKVTTLDDGTDLDPNGNKIYRFAMETQWNLSEPQMPMQGHGTYMIFTTHEKDPNKCHLKWIRKWRKPYIAGLIPLNEQFANQFQGYMQRDLITLWQVYHNDLSPKLPKIDSKVVVVGAGPSGLHMTYELIQRGLAPEGITILEKERRYGGKTLSIESKSNVQISNALYNKPPIKLSMIPKVKALLQKYYTVRTIREAIQFWLDSGSLTKQQFEDIQRQNTPNALQEQPENEYFAGGEPVFHELGTCYLSPGYYAIRSLLGEVQKHCEAKATIEGNAQSKWNEVAKADITREVGPDTYAIESKRWDGKKTLEQWIEYEGKECTPWAQKFDSSPAIQNVAINASVLAAKLKYCRLHVQILGNYTYTMPPRPDFEALQKSLEGKDSTEDILLPFSEFLLQNKLDALEPLFTYALTAQGYGIIAGTPTFLAMQWLTPDLLDGYFEWYYYFGTYKDSVGNVVSPIPDDLKKFDNFRKGMLVSGWGGLWDRIVSLYSLGDKIKYESTINDITRKEGKVTVSYNHNGANIIEDFDWLVMGAPLTDPASKSPEKQLIPLDCTLGEKKVFLNNELEASTFRTNLFQPEENGAYEADHLRIFIDAIMDKGSSSTAEKDPKAPEKGSAGTGEVFGVRDSFKAIQPRLSTTGGDRYDPSKSLPREKMCYQYVSPENNAKYAGQDILTKNFKEFLKQHPEYFDQNNKEGFETKLKKMDIRFMQWTYYTHYKKDALVDGKPWQILELQGQNQTYFVHASTNFESVLDIVNYNNMLLDGLSGRLDETTKPDADTRPEPWQRPQMLLFERVLLHKLFRHILNFIILILWSVWYVVSYPFAELVYLRYQRYNLQKAFKTPDLGNWWTYTQTKFTDVSPLTRGYLDYIKGKPNGIPNPIPEDFDPYKWDEKLGPGDTVFKIVFAPKNKFKDRHPEIPDPTQIPTSIFWNVTDVRTAVRFWLTTFTDDFMPILSPPVQSLVQWFSNTFPNYYSWFFAWIFASQFRLLIGFSYRFEDKQGGGLRIPDCSMLKQNIKDYGLEAGQRICLTVCKVFVEEIMRKKKMKIDFQPDYLHAKGGYGCTVRMENPINHTYSNHSLYESFRTIEETTKFKNIDVSW